MRPGWSKGIITGEGVKAEEIVPFIVLSKILAWVGVQRILERLGTVNKRITPQITPRKSPRSILWLQVHEQVCILRSGTLRCDRGFTDLLH